MDEMTPDKRFWARVEKGRKCWKWLGKPNTDGYGVFRDGERLEYAHRYAYLLLVGDIRPGKALYNTCGDRLCINPEHWTPDKPIQQMIVRYNKPKRGRRGNFRHSDAVVQAVRETGDNTSLTQTAIAARYHISQAQVSRIIAGLSR